jgi:hypothetical protein
MCEGTQQGRTTAGRHATARPIGDGHGVAPDRRGARARVTEAGVRRLHGSASSRQEVARGGCDAGGAIGLALVGAMRLTLVVRSGGRWSVR